MRRNQIERRRDGIQIPIAMNQYYNRLKNQGKNYGTSTNKIIGQSQAPHPSKRLFDSNGENKRKYKNANKERGGFRQTIKAQDSGINQLQKFRDS